MDELRRSLRENFGRFTKAMKKHTCDHKFKIHGETKKESYLKCEECGQTIEDLLTVLKFINSCEHDYRGTHDVRRCVKCNHRFSESDEDKSEWIDIIEKRAKRKIVNED